jgi:hypothetical protein
MQPKITSSFWISGLMLLNNHRSLSETLEKKLKKVNQQQIKRSLCIRSYMFVSIAIAGKSPQPMTVDERQCEFARTTHYLEQY